MTFLFWAVLAFSQNQAPHFTKEKIQVGRHSIVVEVADEPSELSHGLMFRKTLEPDQGMLFVFPDEAVRGFWMKNTFIPLSIAFFNRSGKLIDIQDMAPVVSEIQEKVPLYQSKGPAQFALEMPQGWFRKKGVKPGQRLVRQNQSR